MRLTIDVHEAQQQFLNSSALYRGFVGGRGTGKSYIGALDILLRAMSKGKRLYAVYAPTYPMLHDSSWRSLLDVGERLRCIRQVNRSDMRLILGNDAEIICRSVDDPERARGPNLSGAWLDEASLIKAAAYPIVIACLREGGEQGWLSATFTPKGKSHWTYETFGQGRPDTELFRARTADNPFLPPGFEDTLRAQYPSHFAQQELEGEFIDPPGSIFRREWFQIVDKAPDDLRWVRYWDLAVSTKTTADYTASVAVAMADDGVVYLRDMIRGRWEWPDQEKIMVETMLAEPSVEQGIEKALHGIAALQALSRRPDLARHTLRGITVDKDKLTRALPLAARAEQGKVALVRGAWVAPFLDELCAFTGDGTTHDDQVDTAAGGLAMLSQPMGVEYAPSLWG
jgi:predicted phage terminase large subunit-like protein